MLLTSSLWNNPSFHQSYYIPLFFHWFVFTFLSVFIFSPLFCPFGWPFLAQRCSYPSSSLCSLAVFIFAIFSLILFSAQWCLWSSFPLSICFCFCLYFSHLFLCSEFFVLYFGFPLLYCHLFDPALLSSVFIVSIDVPFVSTVSLPCSSIYCFFVFSFNPSPIYVAILSGLYHRYPLLCSENVPFQWNVS